MIDKKTEISTPKLNLIPVQGKNIELSFNGDRISSDGGLYRTYKNTCCSDQQVNLSFFNRNFIFMLADSAASSGEHTRRDSTDLQLFWVRKYVNPFISVISITLKPCDSRSLETPFLSTSMSILESKKLMNPLYILEDNLFPF